MDFNIEPVENPTLICPELATSMKDWEWTISKCRHWWWVAFVVEQNTASGNAPWAGYSGLSIYDRETVMFGPVLVRESYRGCGLQRKMFLPKERFAKENGFKTILACTDIPNIYSSNNLIALGFKLRKPWPEAAIETLKRNTEALYWEKKLA